MTAAEKYVAATYLGAFLAALAYVLIVAVRLHRLEQRLGALAVHCESRERSEGDVG
jgi:hypothetical protein